MKYKKSMQCLAIEVTRRCNLNCDFCCKGTPQNIDISKSVIDKTLLEMKDTYIDILRISGGEPFLVPELIEYLFAEIIRRKIAVNKVAFFTNGTIRNETIVTAIKNLLVYLRKIEPSLQENIDYYRKLYRMVYKGTENTKVCIVVSTFHHENDTEIDKTIGFYKQIKDNDFNIVSQSDTFSEYNNITIEGNAEINYKSLIPDIIDLENFEIRIVENKYNFITQDINADSISIDKTISVLSNGNVFVGCSLSYMNVDKDNLFNICECDHDFYERIIEYCWKHPISKKANRMRECRLFVKWCIDHDIKLKDKDSEQEFISLNSLCDFINMQEKLACKLHEEYPCLTLDEIDVFATAAFIESLFECGGSNEQITNYIKCCIVTESDDVIKDFLNRDYLHEIIENAVIVNEKRKTKNNLLSNTGALLGVLALLCGVNKAVKSLDKK